MARCAWYQYPAPATTASRTTTLMARTYRRLVGMLLLTRAVEDEYRVPRTADGAPPEHGVDGNGERGRERRCQDRQSPRELRKIRQQSRLEGRRVDARDRVHSQAARSEEIEIVAAPACLEDRGIAVARKLGRRGLEQHHAPALGQMVRHAHDSGLQCIGIENVLQHRYAEDEVELRTSLQRRKILRHEAAAVDQAGLRRATSRLRDHRWAEIDARDARAAPREDAAPSPDTAAHIKHPHVRPHAEPGLQGK